MNQSTRSPLVARQGIIQYLTKIAHCSLIRSAFATVVVTLLLAGTAATPVSAQTVIYQSDFSGDTIGGQPSGWNQNYIVAADPLDSEVKVMASPGGNSRTSYDYHTEATTTVADIGLQLAFSFYYGDAGSSWNTAAFIQQSGLSNGAFFSTGYGLRITSTTIQIQKTVGEGSSTNQGSASILRAGSIPANTLQEDSWNDVVFTWKQNGELSVTIGGSAILTTNDTSYAPSYRSLKFSNFTNNANGTGNTDLQAYYKDISVSSIPESSTMAAVLGLAVLGFVLWQKRLR